MNGDPTIGKHNLHKEKSRSCDADILEKTPRSWIPSGIFWNVFFLWRFVAFTIYHLILASHNIHVASSHFRGGERPIPATAGFLVVFAAAA